jgi:ERCC4-related helicase
MGLLSAEELAQRQQELPTEDVRDTKTGDEEETEAGREESERQDEEIAGATAARNLQELRREAEVVQRLVALAGQVYEQKQESKFERLWQAMEDYAETKVLVFTEFRDTLYFLVDHRDIPAVRIKASEIIKASENHA